MLTPNQLKSLIEDALQKSEFRDYPLTQSDLLLTAVPGTNGIAASIGSIHREENFIWKILNGAAANRKDVTGTYYHFKGIDLAKSILQKGTIQASNLLSNISNDQAEAEEFVRRYGNVYPLTSGRYHKGEIPVNIPDSRPIDELRKSTCILCFTSGYGDPRFWKRYIKNGNGVCFEFEYAPMDPQAIDVSWADDRSRSQLDLYDLREVCYDTGYLFDFINDINTLLYAAERKILHFPGLTKMASWYKRARYAWERETRLVFDYQWIKTLKYSGDLIRLEHDGNRSYVSLPITNFIKGHQSAPIFSLLLRRVIYDNTRLVQHDVNEIIDLVKSYSDAKAVNLGELG